MATKPKKETKASTEAAYPRKSVNYEAGETDIDTARNYAKVLTSSSLSAFRVLNAAEQNTGLDKMVDVPALMGVLEDQVAAVNRNDMTQVEGMLMNQATALQSLFARLSEKALGTDYVSTFDTMMKMALRAQNQCRATLETLAAIKNPPVVIAKQANVTSGPQQINNGVEPYPPARKNEIEQTKLSGGGHELLTDAGASRLEGQPDPALETMGEVHRAEDRRGKGKGSA